MTLKNKNYTPTKATTHSFFIILVLLEPNQAELKPSC